MLYCEVSGVGLPVRLVVSLKTECLGRLWMPTFLLCTQHPAPYTLYSTPCTLHPQPSTLHPPPYTLHPTCEVSGVGVPVRLVVSLKTEWSGRV